MWARVIEVTTAVWLAISPWVFASEAISQQVVAVDLIVALVICCLAGLSYWPPTRHSHLLTLGIAIGLILWGRFAAPVPPPPVHQNHIVVGLFLLMIAIVPNHASHPPAAWRGRGSVID